MPPKRRGFGLTSVAALVAVVAAVAVIGSAGAQTPAAPTLVSAAIIANNFKQGERSTVQYTFSEPVSLPNGDSGVGTIEPDYSAADLSKFSLGSAGTHPVAASVESNGLIVEADFPPSLNVGLFETASVEAGAVMSTQGAVTSERGSARLTIVTLGTTSGPNLKGADIYNLDSSNGGPLLPPMANDIEFYFDKPIENVVPGDFGYYAPGTTTPIMGTGIAAGGFTPGAESVVISFPGTPSVASSGIFALRGAATGTNGQASPVRLSNGDGSGNVAGVPGLLATPDENSQSVTRAGANTFDFTFNEAPSAVTPSDFLLYTAQDGQIAGSAATVAGQVVKVTFPLPAHADVVLGAVVRGAVTVNGVENSVGSEAVGPRAGFFTGTAVNRGMGFTPTGPSIKNSPATIPDAACAPSDHPETGLQGQVPPAVRAAGFKGFNCNLTELGQYPAAGATWRGGTWVGSWAGHCAYLSTPGSGIIVIDASDPSHPVTTGTLTPPGFLNTWETLKYNPTRQLLAAASHENPWLAIYNASDCAHPVLDASVNLGPIAKGHAGNWAPDGKTYYDGNDFLGPGAPLTAIDTTDPTHPTVLGNFALPENTRPHDLSLNSSGTVMYMNQLGSFGRQGSIANPNGLVVLNVSQVQHRVPNAKISLISTLYWNDTGVGQQTLPITYNGQTYLMTTDELGSGGVGTGGRAGACARGLSPYGFARLININNPRHPFIVSKLRLQVDNPTKCDINDDAPNTASFGYDSHYCNVNRLNNPTMLGCGYFEAGMRLFDVANPRKPSEIGYFNPPPGHDTASQHRLSSPIGATQTDWASSPPVFVGCNVWDQFQDNGYIFMKITHGPGKRLCKVDSPTANSNLM